MNGDTDEVDIEPGVGSPSPEASYSPVQNEQFMAKTKQSTSKTGSTNQQSIGKARTLLFPAMEIEEYKQDAQTFDFSNKLREIDENEALLMDSVRQTETYFAVSQKTIVSPDSLPSSISIKQSPSILNKTANTTQKLIK